MKILLNNIKIFAYHGLYSQEKILGNWFNINLEINYKKKLKYSTTDNSLIDYVEIYEILKKEFLQNEELLENLCIRISLTLTEKFKSINYLKIQITKKQLFVDNFEGNITVEYETKN